MRSASLVLLLSLLTCGCVSTSGKPIDHSALDRLQKGRSTAADARQLLGQPTGSQSNSDGSMQMVYTYSSVNTSFYGLPGSGATAWEECRLNFSPGGVYAGSQCNSTGSNPSTR